MKISGESLKALRLFLSCSFPLRFPTCSKRQDLGYLVGKGNRCSKLNIARKDICNKSPFFQQDRKSLQKFNLEQNWRKKNFGTLALAAERIKSEVGSLGFEPDLKWRCHPQLPLFLGFQKTRSSGLCFHSISGTFSLWWTQRSSQSRYSCAEGKAYATFAERFVKRFNHAIDLFLLDVEWRLKTEDILSMIVIAN